MFFERRFLMFDFDAGKLITVGIVASIVIGPKELPRVMLQVGQAAAKMRRMAAEFRSPFKDVVREAEIDDTKSDVERLAESAKAATGMEAFFSELSSCSNFFQCVGKQNGRPLLA